VFVVSDAPSERAVHWDALYSRLDEETVTATEPIPPITGAVTVGLPVDQAFRVIEVDRG
jgi:hypothetical protein